MKSTSALYNAYYTNEFASMILVIEDILRDEFEPKEVVMHGLRLSVECRGGKQRIIRELVGLFSNINYKLEKMIQLDTIHTMLVMGSCDD